MPQEGLFGLILVSQFRTLPSHKQFCRVNVMRDASADDTIAALATPPGEGAIAVIRCSGNNAITAIDSVFAGRRPLSVAAGYTVHHGTLRSAAGEMIDDVLVTVFRKPHSYTGEDSIEISCHGGRIVANEVLSLIRSLGIRMAEPGEFTKRAFLNGKLDLSQAEAVAELISSKSKASYRAAIDQLEGRFSAELRSLRDEILQLTSLLELELDFSEEGIDLLQKSELRMRISKTRARIRGMIDTYKNGRVYREGVKVAIVGKPNAGKSSLFNALLRENRAIVAEIPGTTRDFLEENVYLDGVQFRLTDTAGLRDSLDPVETEGVARAKSLLGRSDLAVLVVDPSDPVTVEDVSRISNSVGDETRVLVALNKSDLSQDNVLKDEFPEEIRVVRVSAKTGSGLTDLRSALIRLGLGDHHHQDGVLVTSDRHKGLLVRAEVFLTQMEVAAGSGLSGEFIAVEARGAADSLSEIIGEVTTDDVLSSIFQKFCIGK